MFGACAALLLSLSISTAGAPFDFAQGPFDSAQAKAEAAVSGTVLDVSGGAVSGAEITLTKSGEPGNPGNPDTRSAVAGADGTFVFTAVPAGSYAIAISAPGFQPYTSATFVLTPQQSFHVSGIVLSIAAMTTAVDVRPTEVVAAEQVKAQEQQRVFGAIPDFYTSYVWNAAPLNTKQKFSLALRKTFDPVALVGVSVGAGIEQATNFYPGYGQGLEGYGKRWGALFATGRISDILSRAVFPSLFHQDPRYFYQGSGSNWSRAGHALGDAFVARSDSGHLMPSYSYLLGNISSAALSNLYYPDSSRGVGLILTNAAIGIGGRAAQNLIREFLFKRLTKHVPGRGKPATSTDNP